MVHFAAALIAGSALLLQNVAALAIGAPFEVEKRASLITHTGIVRPRGSSSCLA